jgi:hypothetical protein
MRDGELALRIDLIFFRGGQGAQRLWTPQFRMRSIWDVVLK